jgi:hypothetical protein
MQILLLVFVCYLLFEYNLVSKQTLCKKLKLTHLANSLLFLFRSSSYPFCFYAFTQKVEPDEAIDPAVSAEKIDGDGALIEGATEVVEE